MTDEYQSEKFSAWGGEWVGEIQGDGGTQLIAATANGESTLQQAVAGQRRRCTASASSTPAVADEVVLGEPSTPQPQLLS